MSSSPKYSPDWTSIRIRGFSKIFSNLCFEPLGIKVDSFSIDPGAMSYYNIDGDIVKSQKASVRVIPEAINLLI